MSPAATVLASLRQSRLGGPWLFVLLILLVGTERRLSEFHFNLRSFAPGLESTDALDGDEIRVRLIVLNDEQRPSLPDTGRVLVSPVVCAAAPLVVSIPLGRPAPRGPPPAVV